MKGHVFFATELHQAAVYDVAWWRVEVELFVTKRRDKKRLLKELDKIEKMLKEAEAK